MVDTHTGRARSPQVTPSDDLLTNSTQKSGFRRGSKGLASSKITGNDEMALPPPVEVGARSSRDIIPPREQNRSRFREWWPLIILLKFLIIAVLMGCLLTLAFHSKAVETLTQRFLMWVKEHHVWGAFVYMCVFAIGTVFFLPAEAVTIGGGFIFTKVFGFWKGFFVGWTVCIIGAHLSMLFCFLLSRHLLFGFVNTLLSRYRIFRAVNAALRNDGRKVCALLRLAPVLPFTLLNFMCGVTAVTLEDYLIGSTAYTPVLALYIYVGSTVSQISDASQPAGILHPGLWGWIAIASGTLILGFTILYIIHLTREQLALYDGNDSDCLLEAGQLQASEQGDPDAALSPTEHSALTAGNRLTGRQPTLDSPNGRVSYAQKTHKTG